MDLERLYNAAVGYASRALYVLLRIGALFAGSMGWFPILGVLLGPVMAVILASMVVMTLVRRGQVERQVSDPALEAAMKRILMWNNVAFIIGIVLAITGALSNLLFGLILSGGTDQTGH